jgi:DNA primase
MFDVISIRRANPVAEVAAEAGIELRAIGRRLIGRCPLHRDARPSLVVYPHSQSYFCFGCGAGGDVIDFVARINGLSFKEAAARLASPGSRRGSPAPAGPQSPARIGGITPREAETVEVAVRHYHAALLASNVALGYLQSRGIKLETARQHRLGFADGALAESLRKGRTNLGVGRSIGLLHGEGDAMLGRLVVPELRAGKAVWLTGRSTDGREPRYLNVRLPKPLLGLEQVRGDEVVLVEGPFDWLSASQWGLPAVALAGSHVSPSTVRVLSRFRRVYLALDNDEAGLRASAQLKEALAGKARRLQLPQGVKDVNDLAIRPDGRDLFMRCLGAASRKEYPWDSNDAAPAPRAA